MSVYDVKEIPIDKVVLDFGVELKQVSEDEMEALCPFHDESHPSFRVNTERNVFHCFGCNKGGDVITFVEEFKGIGFKEAVSYLMRKYNIKYSFPNLEKIRKEENYRKEILVLYERVQKVLDDIWYNEWFFVKPFYEVLKKYDLRRDLVELVFDCLVPICDFDIFEYRYWLLSYHVDSFFSSVKSDYKGLRKAREFYKSFLKRGG